MPADGSNESAGDGIRLQVYLARSGVASRRASETLIAAGRVAVNGEAVTAPGTKVSPADTVTLDGKPVTLESQKRYVLLNKPAGYVCSLADEAGRPTAAELLRGRYNERLYNVGRLDLMSQGLIIFTNDGDFAALLSHPSAELEKEYIVDGTNDISESIGKDFEKGLRIEGVFYRCVRAELLSPRKMRIVLTEGKNREIRRVFAAKKIGIRRLTRVRIGIVRLEDLKEGQFRDLTAREVAGLISLCKRL